MAALKKDLPDTMVSPESRETLPDQHPGLIEDLRETAWAVVAITAYLQRDCV